MAQLVVAKEMRHHLKRAEAVWAHSVDVAAIAFVLARKTTGLNPDEALFAGLLHDVGRFYLLSKLPNYPELTEDPVALEAVLDEWHASIGHAVLGTIGLPDAVLDAVAEHESANYCATPRSLTDVIAVANLLSKSPNPLQRPDSDVPPEERVENPDMRTLLELLEASSDELMSLVVALRA